MSYSPKQSLGLVCLLLCCGVACAGPKFKERKTDAADGGTAGGGAASGDTSPDAGAAGATTAIKTRETDCGSARDALASHQVELCVPAGTFTMGSTSPDLPTGHFSHTTTHDVTLSAFLIDAFEVTVARYRACVVAGTCRAPSTDTSKGCTYTEEVDASEELPASCLTYAQAREFCGWDDGRRLPTEAEWERTAAGAHALAYPWGDTFTCPNAVLASGGLCADVYSSPEAVGSHATGVSPAGAYDMAGNVAEWVSDYAGPYESDAETDPTGPTTGVYRLTRGGSFKSPFSDGQTFVRVNVLGTTVGAIGVRCVKPVE
jgi:formylglycine-generating enzyme required for sulfatase activity